jgi:DUF1009 family protein
MSIGLIAGGGALPFFLLEALHCEKKPVCVVALQGVTSPELVEGVPHLWISLGEIIKVLDFFKAQGVFEIVMAGKVPRPSLNSLKVDWKGALWAAQFSTRWSSGDDALLRFLGEKLESEGFQVIAPQDILRTLLGKEGPMTSVTPCTKGFQEIHRGLHALHVLSSLDMGQAIVVQQGLFLGVEGVEGTNGLVERCAPFQKEGPAAILVKGAKAQQDVRFDLPALGTETVKAVIQAGFQGIAFEVSRTLILYPEEMKKIAKEAGIFLIGVKGQCPITFSF